MLDSALALRGVTYNTQLKAKSILAAALVVLAVALPQIVHLALGQPGGVKWLPMYLPVLLAGCLLGIRWGLLVGILSPMLSFVLTSAVGTAMPSGARLPFMVIELAIFAVVTGLFSKKIIESGLWAFPAVIIAQVVGRAVFLGSIAITQSITEFTPGQIWGQIITGIPGLAVQAVIVPLIIIGVRYLMLRHINKNR